MEQFRGTEILKQLTDTIAFAKNRVYRFIQFNTAHQNINGNSSKISYYSLPFVQDDVSTDVIRNEYELATNQPTPSIIFKSRRCTYEKHLTYKSDLCSIIQTQISTTALLKLRKISKFSYVRALNIDYKGDIDVRRRFSIQLCTFQRTTCEIPPNKYFVFFSLV